MAKPQAEGVVGVSKYESIPPRLFFLASGSGRTRLTPAGVRPSCSKQLKRSFPIANNCEWHVHGSAAVQTCHDRHHVSLISSALVSPACLCYFRLAGPLHRRPSRMRRLHTVKDLADLFQKHENTTDGLRSIDCSRTRSG